MRRAAATAVAALALGGAGVAALPESRATAPVSRVAQDGAPPSPVRTIAGRSALGRPVTATRLGAPGAARTILVVGAVHGDEPAGRAVARRLAAGPAPRRTELWVVPDLNPDGSAAGTRVNSRGVDLNRNFPHGWRRGPRGRYYPGPRPASEPETRVAQRLIRRVQPDLTIWLHQPYGIVVDARAADGATERRVARRMRLPLRRLPRYPGTAVAWQRSAFPRSDSVVVELGPSRLDARAAELVAQRLRGFAP